MTKTEQEIFKAALRKMMGGPGNNMEFLEAAALLKKKMALTLTQMYHIVNKTLGSSGLADLDPIRSLS